MSPAEMKVVTEAVRWHKRYKKHRANFESNDNFEQKLLDEYRESKERLRSAVERLLNSK